MFDTEKLFESAWGLPVCREYVLGPNAFQVQMGRPHVALITVDEGAGICGKHLPIKQLKTMHTNTDNRRVITCLAFQVPCNRIPGNPSGSNSEKRSCEEVREITPSVKRQTSTWRTPIEVSRQGWCGSVCNDPSKIRSRWSWGNPPLLVSYQENLSLRSAAF